MGRPGVGLRPQGHRFAVPAPRGEQANLGRPGVGFPIRSRRRRRLRHQIQQRLGYRHLAAAAAAGQVLNGVQGLVAGDGLLGLEHRRREHHAHQRAAAGHDVGPVGIADGAQRRHGIAHAQVVGRLVSALLGQQRGAVGQGLVQPGQLRVGRHRAAFGVAAPVAQAQRHLAQKHPAYAAQLQRGQQAGQRRQIAMLDLVAAQVGGLAGGLVRRHALGQPAQVFNQHHPQGGGQGPHLAQVQGACFLVGAQKLHQQVFIKRAVGVRHKGPGDAVDARQAGQRLVHQHRQLAEEIARQAGTHRFELGFDEVEVVQQPLGRRADVVTRGRLLADVGVGFAQHPDIALQPGRKGLRPRRQPAGLVRLAQAAAVLGKTLRAEDLRPDRCLGRPAGAVENLAQGPWRLRDQALQRVLRHGLRPPGRSLHR